ncbi:MAG: glycoside hydrolase family 99-like domain-containing protein [Glaciimonas sp.]|nr:glycoside hydrolase family 99-like domain-containing protein [Glaciimonas sp.]
MYPMAVPKPRLIAYYLPQYHPIKENDEWWGRGFTEWTNTAKAKPLFPGHYQPHVPADLGFYDLRLAASRKQQADLARSYGIEAFCYYHYWFGNGRRLLEQPFDEVLSSGEPDFPFCLCWANDTWSGVWHGAPDKILIKQEYPGIEDEKAHFSTLLKAFKDPRYLRVDNKQVFIVWRPYGFPNPAATVLHWREMARESGLVGLHLVGIFREGHPAPEDIGYDASIYTHNPPPRTWGTWRAPLKLFYNRILRKLGIPSIYSYEKAISYYVPDQLPATRYPSVVNGWDNSPRSGVNGLVLTGTSPALFGRALKKAFGLHRKTRTTEDGRLVFLKSWNEWAEGNHLEPDLRDGHSYLKVVQDSLKEEIQTYCKK